MYSRGRILVLLLIKFSYLLSRECIPPNTLSLDFICNGTKLEKTSLSTDIFKRFGWNTPLCFRTYYSFISSYIIHIYFSILLFSISFNSTILSRSSAADSKSSSAAAFFMRFSTSLINFSSSSALMDSGSFSKRSSS